MQNIKVIGRNCHFKSCSKNDRLCFQIRDCNTRGQWAFTSIYLLSLTQVVFRSAELPQTKQNLKDHHPCKLSMFSTCYDPTDTRMQAGSRQAHAHIDCGGNPPLASPLLSPNEWNRSRSKLINVPTAPERFLVRWQQCLLTVTMNTNAEYYWTLLLILEIKWSHQNNTKTMRMTASKFACTKKSDNQNTCLSPCASCCVNTLSVCCVCAALVAYVRAVSQRRAAQGLSDHKHENSPQHINANITWISNVQLVSSWNAYLLGELITRRRCRCRYRMKKGMSATCVTNGIHVTVFIDSYVAIRVACIPKNLFQHRA